MIRVAVLLGGASSERAVSLRSGAMVVRQLPRSAYHVTTYDTGKKAGLSKLVRDAQKGKIDVVFNALHGTHGEDGHIQGLLEILGLPYTGSGVCASAIAMDKQLSKDLFDRAGLPIIKGLLVGAEEFKKEPKAVLSRIKQALGTEIVIKPNASGSSVGLFVRPKQKDWAKAIKTALKEDSSCLVEKLVSGREITVPVLEYRGAPRALPVIEIRTVGGVFDYHAKYHDKRTQEICPADIGARATRLAQTLAVRAHRTLGCRGYSRTDMMLDEKGRLFILETNTLPGLTQASLLPKSAKAIGMDYPALLSHLIREALYAS
ncbi:D-alanine--D-alanine ligase [Patescibacteria group bacterium]|jgi:D-alanine-D-alanine ligase|nr:D-alanine--D-alanine ligase [Patescibacteria group bacterium]